MKMVRNGSRKFGGGFACLAHAASLCVAAAALTACVGGTTYGTGVSQEAQTIKDISNMFTLRRDRPNIDYAPRPDLVVPQNRQNLPEPLDAEVTTSDPEWPEAPEQRIARIRAEADEGIAADGDMSLEERLRKKDGINIETRDPRGKFVPGRTDRDGVEIMFPGSSSQEARQEVLERRKELNVSSGPNRKYLTEPPVEYRVPVPTAPSGAEAYSEEEVAERKAKEEELAKGNPDLMPRSE
jgi:hypothetical protein